MEAVYRKQTKRKISLRREYREVNRLRQGLERAFTFQLIKSFSDIGNQAADAVEAGGIASVRGLLPSIRRDLERTLNSLYEETVKVFSNRTIANRRSAKAVASFEEIPTAFIRSQGAERITNISTTTQRIIQNVVERNSGAGVSVIATAIRQRFEPRFSRARASTIARTEIHNASAFATHEQQKSFGVPMKKQWMANLDDRTRSTHAAVSGTQVDMDEDFIVGGRKMAYAGDPRGGPANVINCRCVIMYIEPDEEIADAPAVTQQVNPKQKPKRIGIDEIQILAKAVAVDRMEERFRAARTRFEERDPDGAIATVSRFRDRGVKDYYKAKAGTLSKDATSVANALLEETDQLASITGVVPLRGLKGVRGSSALANMGDGVIGLKGKSISALAEKAIKGKVGDADIPLIKSRIATLEADEVKLLRDGEKQFGDWDTAFEKYVAIGTRDGFNATDAEAYKEWRNSVHSLRTALNRERQRLKAVSVQPADTWKFGDNPLDRPYNSDSFFSDPLDKLRSIFYHEFGHNVHQQYLVDDLVSYRNPAIEKWMRANARQGSRKSATRYGDTNQREWFAENFSLYFMDREDLVDPLFIRLIEAIINKRALPDG